MGIVRLLGMALLCTLFAVILRNYKPEMLIPFSVAAGCMLLITALESYREILGGLLRSAERFGVETAYIKVILKVIGMAYAVQFAGDLSRDAGESALAGKIELAGKCLILSCILPLLEEIFSMISDFYSLVS